MTTPSTSNTGTAALACDELGATVESDQAQARPMLLRRVGAVVLLVAVMIAVSVGTWMALSAADHAVTAEGAIDYSTDAYSVTFPGNPEVGQQVIPSTDLSTQTATWNNKQEMYGVSYLPPYGAAPSVDGALAGSLQSSGGTLVDSEPISIDGGSGLVAQTTVDGETIWMMIVVSADGEMFTLLQSGEAKDHAFFDSFRLR